MLTTPLTRRAAISAAISTAIAVRASFAQGTPISGDASTSYLVCAIPMTEDTDALYHGIEVFDQHLQSTGNMPLEEGLIDVEPTGKLGTAFATTLYGAALIDLNLAEHVPISWDGVDPGFILPQFGTNIAVRHPRWILASNVEMTRVLAIDLDTIQGFDITDAVVQSDQEVIPVLPDLPIDSDFGGIWTGDNVSLINLNDLTDATTLTGNKDSWYTTTLNINDEGTYATYTAYDPAEGGEVAEVYLRNIATAEELQILDGTAWSTAYFVPNQPDVLLAVNGTDIEKRSLGAADQSGEVIGSLGDEAGAIIWNADQTRGLWEHSSSMDDTKRWSLIDVSTWTLEDIPELDGKRPFFPKQRAVAPTYLLFGEDSWDSVEQTLTGFSFETGDTWTALEAIYPDVVTASSDGRWYGVGTENKGSNKGCWVIDVQDQSVYAMPYGNRQFSEKVLVSPDGTKGAVVIVSRPSGVRSTLVFATESPDQLEELTPNHGMAWI